MAASVSDSWPNTASHGGAQLLSFGRSATAQSGPRGGDDSALHTPRHGSDLVAADALSDLVRDRGACCRRHGRARHHSQRGGKDHRAKGKNARFDVDWIEEIEREVKHDVVAFLTHLAEIVGPAARFVHQGMTSSDVLDTCLNVQLVRAADL